VKGNTHLAFNSNYGEFLNKLTFNLADWGITKAIMSSMKMLNIPDISKRQIKKVLTNHKVIYTISPSLFPRPDHWRSNLKIMGYHQRAIARNWVPGEALQTFLERHPRPLFITFGRMTNPEPLRKTSIIIHILEKHGIPAIINTAAGGLAEPVSYDRDLIHFVSDIPYTWIFPKAYAVMHHGGSGTTHMALKHGCPTLIIPHIIDQFLWNRLVAKKGAGPIGIKIGRLTRKKLEPIILDLIHTSLYKNNAERIAIQMQNEDFSEALYSEIVN
jgi:UDP:flavonoid glycosyltransferase YjiC (YdhE family)